MNKQREIIYSQRKEILEGISLKEEIAGILKSCINSAVSANSNHLQELNLSGLLTEIKLRFGIELEDLQVKDLQSKDLKDIEDFLYDRALNLYEDKEKALGSDLLRHLERMVFLQIIDSKWKDHLYAMDSLREGIGLRAYGQRDPLVEYKREAFGMFSEMISSIENDAVESVFKLQAKGRERFRGAFSSVSKELVHPQAAQLTGAGEGIGGEDLLSNEPAKEFNPSVKLSHPKIGRNDPCPCGSGRKYKKCCGK
jgi:preprotein translocase subunit SecA